MSRKKTQTAVITNTLRGLYYATVSEEQIKAVADGKKELYLQDARHIAYWHGPIGGITSLAAEGPDDQSRIGKPCAGIITNIGNLFLCSPEAAARFAAVNP